MNLSMKQMNMEARLGVTKGEGLVLSNESVLQIRWPKHWSFSFSISPSNLEYSGLISFRID